MVHNLGAIGTAVDRQLVGRCPASTRRRCWGLWASAPYLHDSRAPDLAAALRSSDAVTWHGDVGALDAAAFNALLAYLLQLDARETPVRAIPAIALVQPRADAVLPRAQPVKLAANTVRAGRSGERHVLVDGTPVGNDDNAVCAVTWTPPGPKAMRWRPGCVTPTASPRAAPVLVTVE
ncbi:MAG: hypothetical protein R2854_05470 [Caldilineaceae bacterium]